MRSGGKAELRGRVPVTAGVTALPCRLLADFIDKSLCGLDLDEVEDPLHRRFEVVDQILVTHDAQVVFGDLARRMCIVEVTQHVARSLVQIFQPPALVFFLRAIPHVVAVLEHAGQQRHSRRDDLDRIADDVDQLAIRVTPQHRVETHGQHAGLGQHAVGPLECQVPSPACVVVVEEAFFFTRRHAVDRELAARQATSPSVLPGKEICPRERAAHSPEEPGHVVGLDAAQAGVVHIGRVVAGRRQLVQSGHDPAEQFARSDRGKHHLPQLESGHVARPEQQSVQKCCAAARVADDEDRPVDRLLAMTRVEHVVQTERDRRNHLAQLQKQECSERPEP